MKPTCNFLSFFTSKVIFPFDGFQMHIFEPHKLECRDVGAGEVVSSCWLTWCHRTLMLDSTCTWFIFLLLFHFFSHAVDFFKNAFHVVFTFFVVNHYILSSSSSEIGIFNRFKSSIRFSKENVSRSSLDGRLIFKSAFLKALQTEVEVTASQAVFAMRAASKRFA